jgi:hypothetical protein
MSSEAWRGIAPHINCLLEARILWHCHSAWNTPLLPVKKPGGKDYRPVQDLREVNKRVKDIHPTVPNAYTLLSYLPPYLAWYTTLDLKDAFFSIALAPNSQHIFAFEWHDENLAAASEAECRQDTGDLLQELGKLGYQASAKKAHICRQTVTYLGYELKEGTRWLTNAMKETILRLSIPTSA